jgi:hypothetical protein
MLHHNILAGYLPRLRQELETPVRTNPEVSPDRQIKNGGRRKIRTLFLTFTLYSLKFALSAWTVALVASLPVAAAELDAWMVTEFEVYEDVSVVEP